MLPLSINCDVVFDAWWLLEVRVVGLVVVYVGCIDDAVIVLIKWVADTFEETVEDFVAAVVVMEWDVELNWLLVDRDVVSLCKLDDVRAELVVAGAVAVEYTGKLWSDVQFLKQKDDRIMLTITSSAFK